MIDISVLISAVEIGRRLKEAKALLPHGEGLKWLAEYNVESMSLKKMRPA